MKEWTSVNRLRNKWPTKEGSKVRRKKTGTGTDDAAVREYLLREVHERTYVHIPWIRTNLFQFSHTLPKLREHPDK